MKYVRRLNYNSRSAKIFRELYAQGKITQLTVEESYELDSKIAEGMEKINEEYQRKCLGTIVSMRAKGLLM